MVKYVNGMIRIKNANNMLAKNAMTIRNLIKMDVILLLCHVIMTKVQNYVLKYHLKDKIALEVSIN